MDEERRADSDNDEELRSSQTRRQKTSTIGAFKYLGKDRVRSRDCPISLASLFMIVAPSLLYLILM